MPRIQHDTVADSLVQVRGGKCRSAREERVIDEFAAPEMVQYRAPHQIDRLLGRMIVLIFVGATHGEFWGRRVPVNRVLAGFAEPGRILLPDEPAGLVLNQ